jgi:hypothetical protein
VGRRLQDAFQGYFVGFLKGYRRTWEFLELDNQNRIKEVLKQSSDEIAQYAIPIAIEYRDLEETCAERLKRLRSSLPLISLPPRRYDVSWLRASMN